MNNSTKILAAIAGVVVALASGHAAADDLGEAATSPVSNLIQFRLQNQYTASSYNADSWGNAAIVQTVVPLSSLANKFDSLKGIVTRTTLPYVSTPELNGVGRKHGMGDTSFLGFAVPEASPEKPSGALARPLTSPPGAVTSSPARVPGSWVPLRWSWSHR